MKNITIIGGGIIGLSCAYFLAKEGCEVTLIDRDNSNEGSSNGNAGMIVPSHIIPLAAPGMISKGIRWMFNSQSPFFVRPRLSSDLLKWGVRFYRSANEKQMLTSIPILRDLSLISRQLFNVWDKEFNQSFLFNERGLLMLYQTKETEHEEREAAQLSNQFGVKAEILSQNEVQQMEPDFFVNVRGGVFYQGDAHINPKLLLDQLRAYLINKNVKFIPNEEVVRFVKSQNKISQIITNTNSYQTDFVVIATGSWSPILTKQLGVELLLQAGKGYSFTLSDMDKNIHIPSILLEKRVAVTPMGNQLRIGGTMEISGLDLSINKNRVKGIVDAINGYYPEMNVRFPKHIWRGLRPCSPDGLPYIGLLDNFQNAALATGHGMMGLSLGPVTGKLISQLVLGKKTEIELEPLSPTRFK